MLTCDRMRRYEGGWHLERKLLFPKRVFLESENEEILTEELWRYNIADVRRDGLFRMKLEEEQFLKELCGESHHLEMSRGILFRGVAKVEEGPLRGMENRICRIDRHKRLAGIRLVMKQESHMILAGLEITEKIV